MRRRDREVTDINEICRILDKADVLHLGLVDNGMPYVVPMNYGYEMIDGKLTFYIHGALGGRKLEVIKNNPVCCAQIECEAEIFEGPGPCSYGCSYYSVMGFGNVTVIEDVEEKIHGMTVMMKSLTGKDFEFNEKLVSIVNVYRIECDSFTAKYRPLPPAHQNI